MTHDTTLSLAGDVIAPAAPAAPPAESPAPFFPVATRNPIRTMTVLAGAGFAMFAAFFLVLSIIPVGSFTSAIAAVNANPNARHINPAQAAAAMGVLNTLTSFMVFLGVLMLMAAFGLLTKKGWGRIAAIGVSLPLLLSAPFGTAFAVFVLYVMLKRGAKADYHRLCAGL